MLKKTIAPLILAALTMNALMPAAPAGAEVKDLGRFSADVPQGWKAKTTPGGASIMAPGQSGGLTITWSPGQGRTAETAAKELAQSLGGASPTVTEDGGYSFQYKDRASGHDAVALIYAEGDETIFISLLGAHPEFEDILDSMEDK